MCVFGVGLFGVAVCVCCGVELFGVAEFVCLVLGWTTCGVVAQQLLCCNNLFCCVVMLSCSLALV